MRGSILAFTFAALVLVSAADGGVATTAIRESAEHIFAKFGRSAAGESLDQVTETAAKAVAKHGDECLPLLRKAGPSGFEALQSAGQRAPEVIKLHARHGDEAIWLISEPRKLALFLKHGDNAADAILKHPGLADTLIGRYGNAASGALTQLGRTEAQHLSMLAADGTLDKLGRAPDILQVVSNHGDRAMDFIWRNKGALVVAAALTSFLREPELYLNGGKQLVVDAAVAPVVSRINWNVFAIVAFGIVSLTYIVRKLVGGATPRST